MLLEDSRREQCRLEAVRGARGYDATKAAQRLTLTLVVVRKRIQPPLHRKRRLQAGDDPPLRGCERKLRRGCWVSARERGPL